MECCCDRLSVRRELKDRLNRPLRQFFAAEAADWSRQTRTDLNRVIYAQFTVPTAITANSQLYFDSGNQPDVIRLDFIFLKSATEAAVRFHCGIRQGVMPDRIPIKDYGKLFLSSVGARGEHAIVRDEICPILFRFGERIFPNFMTTIGEAGIHWVTKLSTNLIFGCHTILNFLVDCRASFVLDGFIPA